MMQNEPRCMQMHRGFLRHKIGHVHKKYAAGTGFLLTSVQMFRNIISSME